MRDRPTASPQPKSKYSSALRRRQEQKQQCPLQQDYIKLHCQESQSLSKMMNDDNSIPVMKKPANMMEVGPNGNNLQAAALQKHPIEVMQKRQGERKREKIFKN